MWAKDYLRQIELFDLAIKNRQLERAKLLEMVSSAQTKCIKADLVDTSTNLHKGEDIIIEAMEIEMECLEAIGRYINLRHDVLDLLERLKDPLYVKVLHARYVELKSFAEIACDTGYSRDRIKHIHSDALLAFQYELKSRTKKGDVS